MNTYFQCRINGEHKFSLVKPAEIEGLWDWKDKVHCPSCGSADIQEDLIVSLPKRDLNQLRRENREATKEARVLAAEAQARDSANNPEIILPPIQGAKDNEPLKVKKNILDSIESKRPDNYA